MTRHVLRSLFGDRQFHIGSKSGLLLCTAVLACTAFGCSQAEKTSVHPDAPLLEDTLHHLESSENQVPSSQSPAAASDTSLEASMLALDSMPPVNAADLPAWNAASDQASMELHGNVPYFESIPLSEGTWENYQPLDFLGRPAQAAALLGEETMPVEKRECITEVQPVGFDNEAYPFVDGGFVYNRCHLIAYQLSAENINVSNLITGTRYMNVQGMLPWENKTADYIRQTGNRVYYRVTPIYQGDNLVADGVVMEARSLEDDGAGLQFCVYCWNVQPGVAINYATGANQEDSATLPASSDAAGQDKTASSSSSAKDPALQAYSADEDSASYVLNTSSHKFHSPQCDGVKKMAEHNKFFFKGSREEAVSLGYAPCGLCRP